MKAQNVYDVKQPRILILLDESASMVNKWYGDKERYKAADQIILNLMDSIYKVNDQVEFSLRAFGHQHGVPQNDCYDTKNEVMFSKDNYTQMSLRLADLHPLGVTPIAYSLKEAAENDLVDEQNYSYSIILITDGGESCGGDICEIVKTLIAKKIYFKPYIVSLVDYAPLKTEYACLGDYLQVTKEGDIPTAVGTIVESYRPALTYAKTNPVVIKTPRKEEPVIATVEVPKPVVRKKEPETAPIKPVTKTQTVTNSAANQAPPPPPPTRHTIQVDIPRTDTQPDVEPVKPVATPETIAVTKTPADVPHTVKVTPPPPPLPKEDMETINSYTAIRTFSEFYGDPQLTQITKGDPRKVPVVTFPLITEEKPVAVVPPPPKPVIKPAKPNKPTVHKTHAKVIIEEPKQTEKEVTFTEETEDAKETTLEVYFTDGHGKFYSTTPQVLLIDPNSKKTVQQFWRTIDASGNPDPQHLPVGNYDLTVTGKANLLMHNVVVHENKKNKILVKVNNGTLKFEYEDNPNRPVSEYYAIVTQRAMAGGTSVKQKCSAELEYPAGDYHITVNTLPKMEDYVSLDFEVQTIINIAEPGYIQFTNTNKIGKVSLYCVLGDEYLNFYSMSVSGFPESQKLELKPGLYQAHFIKNPNLPLQSETVVPFQIKSNQITQIELQ
ncbi:MAG TPA: hypothetical protein VN721_17265 [Flavipsychrobacter sp.]|nr:hypothetical protein [Flavipsychrobacter sp.]